MDSINVKMISIPNAGGEGSFNLEAFAGATASAAGKMGLVPAPAIGDQAKFLAGDGTWKAPIGNLSAMTNDAGFITNSVSTLTNYYSKTQADSEFAKKGDLSSVYKAAGSKYAIDFTSALLVSANEGNVFNLLNDLSITSSNVSLFTDVVSEGDSYPAGTNIVIVKSSSYTETSDTTVQSGKTYYALENGDYVEDISLSEGDDISEDTYYELSDSYKFDPTQGMLSGYATKAMISFSGYSSPSAASSHTAISVNDTVQQAIAKLEATVKGIIAGNIEVGHASLADNIPTSSGSGNIYIS